MEKLSYGQQVLFPSKPIQYAIPGFNLGITSSNSPTEMVLMEVNKYWDNDTDPNVFKVKLIPVKDEDKQRFGNETLYSSDLISLIQEKTVKLQKQHKYEYDQENWLDYAVSGFWLTIDGVRADLNNWSERNPINKIKVSGSCLITEDKVYRPSQYTFMGETWPEALAFYQQNKKLFHELKVNLKFDLDDYDCCADGYACFKNHSDNSFVMVSIPFNRDIHNYVTSLL